MNVEQRPLGAERCSSMPAPNWFQPGPAKNLLIALEKIFDKTQNGVTMNTTNPQDCDGANGVTYLPKDEETLSFPPERTCLLVIDPVNDVFPKEGLVGR